MSDEALTKNWIQDLINFNNERNRELFPEMMSSLSKKFNGFESISGDIVHQFKHCFRSVITQTQEKALLFVEYLSTHSSKNFLKVIMNEAFFEAFLELFSEEGLMKEILNILKLWSIVYEKDKDMIPAVFSHIESLEAFGLSLPKEYKSNIEFDKSDSSSTPKEGKQETPIQAQPRFKITSFIESCSKLMEHSKSILEDEMFDEMPEDYRKEMVEGLLGNHRQLLFEATNLKLSNAVDEIKEAVEKAVKGLEFMRSCLERKYDGVEREGVIEAMDFIPNSKQSSMTQADLKVYKTHPCPKGLDCPHYEPNALNENARAKGESQCHFWHSDFDKRRPAENDAGDLVYASHLCFHGKICEARDNCEFSHNYFEKNYHPVYYKTDPCSNEEMHCLQGRYCPYYHSRQEKETWEKLTNSGFGVNTNALTSDEAYDVIQSFMNNLKGDMDNRMEIESEDDEKLKEIMNPLRIIPNHTERVVHRHADIPLKPEQINHKPQECKGKLHSKLLVRKVYENPSILTNVFLRSPCFNGIPFVSNSNAKSPNNSKEVNESEIV